MICLQATPCKKPHTNNTIKNASTKPFYDSPTSTKDHTIPSETWISDPATLYNS